MIVLNNMIVKVTNFPDGTSLIKGISDEYGNFIDWYYESPDELVTLIYLTKHIKTRENSVYLNMPYIPNARMDRVKSPDEVFTLKYFADVINSLGFTEVSVLDPHSYVSEALIDNIEVNTARGYIQRAIENFNPDMLFYPDEGAMKRYSSLVKMPYAFGIKQRDWSTGQIKGLSLHGDIAENVLIVDDICSKGGTFYYAAKALREAGAKDIGLYITHCENSIFNGTFGEERKNLLECGLIDKVYTTNSIFTKEHDKIEVFDIREPAYEKINENESN